MVGFGESISSLIHQDNVWISRAIAVAVLLLLLGNCWMHLSVVLVLYYCKSYNMRLRLAVVRERTNH